MRLRSAEKAAGADAPSVGRLLSAVQLHDYDALLFDLDGTLVDTMPLHHRAYAEVFAARGAELSLVDYMASVGAPARAAIPLMAQAAGMLPATPEEVLAIHRAKKIAFTQILRTSAPQALAASRLIEAAGERKLALVSSGNRDGVMAILETMGWTAVFGAVVSGDDVVNGKPDPEPYLKAAAMLGVVPARCLVLEDAEAGLASGRAAGMSVIDVTQFS
ncbi:HAD family hydrolase [Aminobacter aganoensis]|uniref:HAD superfamily hydrolase (TIGR01509 family) n=1 Tax=Aminobacter aganoensis TaxID=83264 RepID=A0A7X0FB73_9HYPH|nr:HAD-IA family hydrolase [Aminobacter aganoensis]MBB6356497.1 HAD superfamily hydrolase (TIGR01509 family) [Aminobacter aganoensis]